MPSAVQTMYDKSSDIKPVPVLTECCARSTPCRVHVLRSGYVSNAKFQAIHPRCIEMQLEGEQKSDSLQLETLCCVAFHFHHFMCGFMGCVKQIKCVDGITSVQLEFPSELAAKNMRQSFRVPVIRDAGVELTIQLADGSQISGDAVNVSDSGIEVKLQTDDARIVVDCEVRFDLRFRDDRLDLPAIVRRRDQLRRGFQFMHSGDAESRIQLAVLQRVVRSLEQMWLKSRLV